ncbi:MAG: tRNA (adenosine(37)-N6)-dimethylallyltransferase MiaA [Pedobacter sp.]|nr:tRNA (adenosine(37)-N6)-dimethylallyltransferase MiaA [Pedobacter sp.]
MLIILGATAVGKTRLAVALADEMDGEIISADSRQIFRGMDVGTGKDLNEYELDHRQIPFHLINIRDAGEKYHVNAFKEDFYDAFSEITNRNKLPILCGGTGMYIHSLLQHHEFTAVPVNETLRTALQVKSKQQLQQMLVGYPEKLRANADFSSTKRLIRAIEIATYLNKHELEQKTWPEFHPLVIGLHTEVEVRRSRILARLAYRLDHGLIEEVEGLIKHGVSASALSFYGLEYKFVVSYLAGELTKAALKEKLGIAICQFAKRQQTFFRKMEKDGVKINWIAADQDFSQAKDKALELVKANLMK